MRVIGGQFRSRRLAGPPGLATRPTSDRLRETLFNVLAGEVQDARFADLYAGSGAIGIEALSRGAATCFFVERAAPALKVLRSNLALVGVSALAEVSSRAVVQALREDAERTRRQPGRARFDVVCLDPPYEAEAEYTGTLGLLADLHPELLAPSALVVAEHSRRRSLPERFGALTRRRTLTQGDAALSFYRIEVEGSGPDSGTR